MVRRTKGCARCTSRKVKCDQRPVHCRNCERIGKPCPGVYQGLVMVHTYSDFRTKRAPSPPQHRMLPLSMHQPSDGPLHEEFLISTFVAYLTKPTVGTQGHESWMDYLPLLASSSKMLNASTRATTLAFFAHLTNNNALQHEADRCYAIALQNEQIYVENLPHQPPAPHDVCGPLMLMYYELIRPTATGGWTKHLAGASRLMELCGPEQYQNGAPHLMFKALRMLAACLSISNGAVSRFASVEWCTVPFRYYPKQVFDSLVGLLFSVSRHSKLSKRSNSGLAIESAEHMANLEPDLGFLANKLAQNESHYLPINEQALERRTPSSSAEKVPVTNLDMERFSIGGSDFCSILPSTFFPTCWILFSYLNPLGRTGTSRVETLINDSAEKSKSLLDFADSITLERLLSPLNSASRLHLCFSLKIVSDLSPLRSQQDAAAAYLRRMGCEQFVVGN